MIKIGINGFGRIGKSILNQSIVNNKIKVNAINFPGFNIHKIASYINHDSFHKTQPFNISVLDDNNIVSTGSRAICWAKRTLEIFDRLGVASKMMAKGITWETGRLSMATKKSFHSTCFQTKAKSFQRL